MNVYLSFNQLINVNTKRSFAATLRRGGINDETEPRIGSIQLRCKPRCVASCAFSPRGIPPLHKVLFTSRFRQLTRNEYLEIHTNLFILT